jgi:hypothetical protein
MKLLLVSLAGLGLLVGCTSAPEPVSVGPNEYMIAGSDGTGITSKASLLTATLKRANEFCAKDGKIAQVDTSDTAGAQGWSTINAKATFKCVPKPA